jgi:SAM-dependent methyltransferase
MARTAEEFDRWFVESGGDPWGIASAGQVAGGRRPAQIVEFGMFHGDFTRRLSRVFPTAAIEASDISPVAVARARELGLGGNVAASVGDMITIPLGRPGGECWVFLLECLYYLNPEERLPALQRILDILAPELVFISAPITGGAYFTEPALIQLADQCGYRLSAASPVSFRGVLRIANLSVALVACLPWPAPLRRRLARQAVYAFTPKANRA